MPKSVLVTGVAGFIGGWVAQHFGTNGFHVVGLDCRLPEEGVGRTLSDYLSLTLPSRDLVPFIQKVRPEICIHCAGPSSVSLSMEDPASDFSASVPVTFGLLDALRSVSPMCRCIFLSSAAVYGNPDRLPIPESQPLRPISPYGFHKWTCEQLCAEFWRLYQLPTAILRIFSAYGPGLKRQVLWDICKKALTRKILKLNGTGKESRDFVHAQDVAKAVALVAERGSFEAEIYNLGSGTETTIRELADLILAELGMHIPVQFDQTPPPGTPLNWKADIRRLAQIGYVPEIGIKQGVHTYAGWFRKEFENHG